MVTPLAITTASTKMSLRTTTFWKGCKASPLTIKTIALRMNKTGSLNENRGYVRRPIARDLSLCDSASNVRHITTGQEKNRLLKGIQWPVCKDTDIGNS